MMKFLFVCVFSQKQGFANCLRRESPWSVKPNFLGCKVGNKKKTISKFCLLKFLPSMHRVNKHSWCCSHTVRKWPLLYLWKSMTQASYASRQAGQIRYSILFTVLFWNCYLLDRKLNFEIWETWKLVAGCKLLCYLCIVNKLSKNLEYRNNPKYWDR